MRSCALMGLAAVAGCGGPAFTSASSGSSVSPGVDAGAIADADASPIESGTEAGSGRVSAGLVVLYPFDEGSGVVVRDKGPSPSLDLGIPDATKVARGPNFIINVSGLMSSAGAADKIYTRLVATNEYTVEAWVRPSSAAMVTARIVTLSSDAGQRDMDLIANGDHYEMHTRTTNDTNGQNTALDSKGGSLVVGKLQHVVSVRQADGTRRMYVDGTERQNAVLAGDFSNWDTSFPLVVGNTGSGDRAYTGEIHLVAIYSRALGPSEVQTNFAAGAD